MIPTFLHSFLLVYPGVHSLSLTPLICPAIPSHTQLAALTPSFLAGLVILLCGASIRLWSYHVLGSLFTFEVVIKDDHKLITSGPYSYVRHPSYTAFSLALTLPGGSYAYESGMLQTSWGAIFAVSWGRMQVGLVVAAVRQIPVADIALREALGEEWDAWARKTPYALVP